MPEFDNIRKLHGVIFVRYYIIFDLLELIFKQKNTLIIVRRGLYRDGIFRFLMELVDEYNDVNCHPKITFTPPILHPLIDSEVIFLLSNCSLFSFL